MPIKPACQRKTRLAAYLSPTERVLLSEHMLDNVLNALKHCSAIGRIATLSETTIAGAHDWFADQGRGLNCELDMIARTIPDRLVVIHADLPALTADDIYALVVAAGDRCAIAPDRHGYGTNALALQSAPGFSFAFGNDSFAAHRAQRPNHRSVNRLGLGLDVDCIEDLNDAMSGGYLSRSLLGSQFGLK